MESSKQYNDAINRTKPKQRLVIIKYLFLDSPWIFRRKRKMIWTLSLSRILRVNFVIKKEKTCCKVYSTEVKYLYDYDSVQFWEAYSSMRNAQNIQNKRFSFYSLLDKNIITGKWLLVLLLRRLEQLYSSLSLKSEYLISKVFPRSSTYLKTTGASKIRKTLTNFGTNEENKDPDECKTFFRSVIILINISSLQTPSLIFFLMFSNLSGKKCNIFILLSTRMELFNIYRSFFNCFFLSMLNIFFVKLTVLLQKFYVLFSQNKLHWIHFSIIY